MNSSEHALARTDNDNIEDRSNHTFHSQSAHRRSAGVAPRNNSFASYLEFPFIHKRLLLVCTLAGILLGWLAILVWPRSYESEAKLMIRVGRESVALDPTATTSATVMLQKTQQDEIISALEVLNSRQVAENVVNKIGADAILEGTLPDPMTAETANSGGIFRAAKGAASGAVNWTLQLVGVKDDISDAEMAVRALQSSVGIYSPKQSAVIIVDAQSKTPEMAQAIVAEVVQSFLDEHSKGSHTSGSHEFFEQQAADVETQLDRLVASRSTFMQENEIISVEANRHLLQLRMAGIDRDVVTASGQLEQAASEIRDLNMKIAATQDVVVAGSDTTWADVRQRIYALELEERRQAAIYLEDHPSLQQVRAQLKGAQELLTQLKSEREDESVTHNPTKTKLREDLQRQQTHLAGLRSMIEQKDAQRADMQRLTDELLDHERQLTQMDRDIHVKEASLQMLREKLEEARVNDELQATEISNVHVFQPASFVQRAVSPEKKVLAAGFLLFGLATGVGLSLLRQASAPAPRTSADVEHDLGVPVIASIPRLTITNSLRLREQALYHNSCRALISEILFSPGQSSEIRGRSIAIIGVDAGAGASTLAANLAMSCSDDCRTKTILVDADTRGRSVSKMFGTNGKPGLVELVNGSASHDDCLQRAQNAPIDLVASSADTCHELLTASPPEIVQALQAFQNDCDLLIVDLPAASEPDLAVALAQHLDGVIVVIESEKTQTVAAERLLRRLSESDTRVIGVVLNKTHNYLPKVVQRFVATQV